MINWKVRFKNPTWMITVGIPGTLLLVQMLLSFINQFIYPIGFTITDDAINGFMKIINLFAVIFLGIGGVIDPTTKGISDSERAKNYTEPR
ncbi:phage holin [Peribacillus alkalitolerans]|uniref:phage holin n=1 Tax=Peribacillus alkalitolerans TaxID=1550385 RepID=UPI001967FB57|nr:phage holin [Peribacillus alkalitolerans]